MNWTFAGALLMAAGVMLGAFGAHGLRSRLDAYTMSVYERAVFYHFLHALGILLVSALPRVTGLAQGAASVVCALLFGGVLIFSGSLYVLAISGQRWLGAITPVGGLLFIAGWLYLAFVLLRRA